MMGRRGSLGTLEDSEMGTRGCSEGMTRAGVGSGGAARSEWARFLSLFVSGDTGDPEAAAGGGLAAVALQIPSPWQLLLMGSREEGLPWARVGSWGVLCDCCTSAAWPHPRGPSTWNMVTADHAHDPSPLSE